MAFCYSIANIYANKHRYWLQKFLFQNSEATLCKSKMLILIFHILIFSHKTPLLTNLFAYFEKTSIKKWHLI